jgi:predicted transcriptional regulator
VDLSRPYAILCPTLDSDVLHVLAGTNRPLTGREVARLAGKRSHAGVTDVLQRLTEQGLLERKEAGQAYLYTLNRDHLAAPAVILLASLRAELIRRLTTVISAWALSPAHASAFGSAARGDGDTESDIDLFLVRPDSIDADVPLWRGQVDELSSSVYRWTGNHVGIVEVAQPELPRLRREQPPIVQNLRRDAILLYGEPVADLLEPL